MFQTVVSHFLINRKRYIQLFWLGQLLIVIFFVGTILLPQGSDYWSQLGRWSADAALIAFILSIAPGIMKRFTVTGLFAQIQLLLMSFRRQIGLSVFLFAAYHYLWSRGLLLIQFHASLIPEESYEIIGMIAFLLSAPLFITSNDLSVKILGKWWRILHKLVYIITWIIFLHLVFLGRTGWTTVSILITGIAEIISWVVAAHRSLKQQTMTSVPSALPH